MGIAPCTLLKKLEPSRGVVGVAGGKDPKLLLKPRESRRLPEIESLLASGGGNDSLGVWGDGAPKRPPAAGGCLVLFSESDG